MRFDFATANRILFGSGTLEQGLTIAVQLGSKPLVVTGRDIHRISKITIFLQQQPREYTCYQIETEPTIDTIVHGVEIARNSGCDFVIAVGGGSVLDTGKAIAAMATNPGEIMDYLEVVGRGNPLRYTPLPVVAIPTTSGTGSEVTRNAVIGVPEKGVKVSLRHPLMIPTLAIIDPELTCSMSAETTAFTGLDALTQVIEPYVSKKANPMTDMLCQEGILNAAKFLARAYHNGSDMEAREGMAYASLLSGIALANSGLGAVHGFAAVIGGRFKAPHGAVCAAILPAVVRTNILALQTRQPGSTMLDRYQDIAEWLCGKPSASLEDAIEWLERIKIELQIPGLKACGIASRDFPGIVDQAKSSSSMKGNPLELTNEELTGILQQSYS